MTLLRERPHKVAEIYGAAVARHLFSIGVASSAGR